MVQHVEISDVSAYEASQAGTSTGTTADTTTDSSTSAVTTDTSYVSDSSNINISTVTTGSGDSTETTSAIAEANNAIFAINGDYYGFRDTGIVIRNGVGSLDGAKQVGTVTAGEYTESEGPGGGGFGGRR